MLEKDKSACRRICEEKHDSAYVLKDDICGLSVECNELMLVMFQGKYNNMCRGCIASGMWRMCPEMLS